MAEPKIDANALIGALEALPPEQLRAVLTRAGLAPSASGITPDQLQTIMATVGTVNAKAMQEALRKENPFYPEKSVYNPAGKFDDHGQQMPPALTFRRDTYFVGVLLGRAGDLCTGDQLVTQEELALFNRFQADKSAHSGDWTATIEKKGTKEILRITVPSKSIDDRMGLPPLTHILLALLEGEDAIKPDHLLRQVADLRAEVKALRQTVAA